MCVDNDNREQDQVPTGKQSSTRLRPKLTIYLPTYSTYSQPALLALPAPANDTHDNAIVACNLKWKKPWQAVLWVVGRLLYTLWIVIHVTLRWKEYNNFVLIGNICNRSKETWQTPQIIFILNQHQQTSGCSHVCLRVCLSVYLFCLSFCPYGNLDLNRL